MSGTIGDVGAGSEGSAIIENSDGSLTVEGMEWVRSMITRTIEKWSKAFMDALIRGLSKEEIAEWQAVYDELYEALLDIENQIGNAMFG
jgi:hypothetical protein